MEAPSSPLEALMPDVMKQILSKLDCRSLLALSSTNSFMRNAVNDDEIWKSLYHKDLSTNQAMLVPENGWKWYYASTQKILTFNNLFFNIIREKDFPGMANYWLNTDYVSCIHSGQQLCYGYNEVIESWRLELDLPDQFVFHVRLVRVRVESRMAWVTMRVYINRDLRPLNVTNVFEFADGQWRMVHHHASVVIFC